MTLAPPAGGRSLQREFLTRRSFALLALGLLFAAVFAGLCQWQISRAVEQGTVVERPTERSVPLNRIAAPGTQQTDASVGQLVTARGRLVPQDTLIVADRLNDGRRGWWVIGHAVLEEPAGAQLAVALGWAPDRAAATAAAERARATPAVPQALDGRYVDSDAAEPTVSGPPGALESASTARLVNLWTADDPGPTYEGVLTLRQAPDGLASIYSPRPGEEVELNLLNILYAAEWALFAVAAVYVWYRLVRDRWEQDRQALEEARAPEPAELHA